jgi:GT2 family glycosyltransferase
MYDKARTLWDRTPATPEIQPGLAVVTINFNGWRDTLDCLTSLRASEGAPPWRLIIVDNGSSDDSLHHLLPMAGSDTSVMVVGKNMGWTGGNNIGIQAAAAMGFERVLLLNNDARVEPNTLAALWEGHEAEPGAVLGLNLIAEDGSYLQGGAIIDKWTAMPRWQPLLELRYTAGGLLRKCRAVCGGAMFARIDTFREVGPLDDTFFLYYDDVDFCARARAIGIKTRVVNRARVIHKGAAASGGTGSPLVAYFMTRNSLLYGERHAKPMERIRQARVVLGRIVRELGDNSPQGRARRAALRDYLLRRFGDCPRAIRT